MPECMEIIVFEKIFWDLMGMDFCNRCRAQQIKCRNADHPDVHGHYREARYTQTKHHWWWKANFVFGRIETLRNYTGTEIFSCSCQVN